MRVTSLASLSRTLVAREAFPETQGLKSAMAGPTGPSSVGREVDSEQQLPSPFTDAHRSYVKSLYKRILKNELDWLVRRDIWRTRAIEVRAKFESNRDIRNPRQLAQVLADAEKNLKENLHPDPYKPPTGVDGTKWERNLPPKMFSEADKKAFLESIKDIL